MDNSELIQNFKDSLRDTENLSQELYDILLDVAHGSSYDSYFLNMFGSGPRTLESFKESHSNLLDYMTESGDELGVNSGPTYAEIADALNAAYRVVMATKLDSNKKSKDGIRSPSV